MRPANPDPKLAFGGADVFAAAGGADALGGTFALGQMPNSGSRGADVFAAAAAVGADALAASVRQGGTTNPSS